VAPPAGTLRVGRYFAALLVIFAVLYAIVFWPGQRHTPKLGLDLVGGAQVIFQARTPDGSTPSASAMTEAKSIMEQRVNGSGVANAEVVIQGSNQIVVSIPGKSVGDLTELGKAAKLNFRPIVMPPVAYSATTSGTTKKSIDPLKGLSFAVPKSEADYDKLTATQQQQLQTAAANFDCSSKTKPPDIATSTLLACDDSPQPSLIYLLGPVIVPGTEIASAQAVPPNTSGTGGLAEWSVSLDLKSTGQKNWADYTSAHHSTQSPNIPPVTECGASAAPCAEYVAFTLDGQVISAPHNEAAINGGATSISGSFTQDSAQTLARQLKYGALPLDFDTLTSQNVSASLGSSQLKAGLLAGGIGLVLVVVYSLIYYRALGLVTIASLIVSGGLIYPCLVILGRQIGFTLTLAGIAGFIVAVGITADSFVVFFERIKDEVHDGRSMRVAVPRAWVRARRTILSADTVSFLAAAVLYYFAAGDVKGFAFTLGLSTILDLVVVFLFTHPMISLLSRSRAFGSARFTGLDAVREGGVVAEPIVTVPTVRSGRPRKADRPAGATAVAVLDREEVEAAEEPATEEPAAPVVASAPVEADDAPADRAAATPQPGTAAERAAARRARLRAEAGQQGSDR
jgi:preprotein translocase subunit SecD